MNFYLSFAILVMFLSATSTCQKSDVLQASSSSDLDLSAEQQDKVKKDNAFTLDLFSTAIDNLSADNNAMLSPLSVNMALSMVANGARGATQSEIYGTLKSGGYESSFLNDFYKTLITKLPALDPKVNLEIANSIWYREGFAIEPAFLKTNKNFYEATAEALSFDSPAATKIINEWVEKKTKGKIRTIVDKIDQDMRMYLINAIYFKGAWSKPFDKDRTRPMEFNASHGTLQAPFMVDEGSYLVSEGIGFKAIEIPYGDTTYSMIAFLPGSEVTPRTLLNELIKEGRWEEELSKFQRRQTRLSLPKFKFSYENSLNDELEKMGMGLAFSDQADFKGINKDGGLTLSEVKQKTFIEVNEEGTEAAAVTSVGVSVTSMPQYFMMNFDCPFLFFIRENSSGLILFAGQINNPLID